MSILLVICIAPDSGSAATLKLTASQTAANHQLTLEIDEVEKLAGLKISVTYAEKTLKFISAKKTKETSSFMHVVNDKQPGKLIIVMASAKGITGSGVALFTMDFQLLSHKEGESTEVTTSGCQLMSEDLKELACSVTPLTIDF